LIHSSFGHLDKDIHCSVVLLQYLHIIRHKFEVDLPQVLLFLRVTQHNVPVVVFSVMLAGIRLADVVLAAPLELQATSDPGSFEAPPRAAAVDDQGDKGEADHDEAGELCNERIGLQLDQRLIDEVTRAVHVILANLVQLSDQASFLEMLTGHFHPFLLSEVLIIRVELELVEVEGPVQ
jgi:hypothetical protein